MNNKDWGTKLKEKAKGRVRLPSDKKIVFSGDEQCLEVKLSKAALTHGNMQDNNCAFEAWTLALMAGCEVSQVKIVCEVPDEAARRDSKHYQRALYRLHAVQ